MFQALLTGLAVMCPDDPYQFIIDKLKFLLENGLDKLEWYIYFLFSILFFSVLPNLIWLERLPYLPYHTLPYLSYNFVKVYSTTC